MSYLVCHMKKLQSSAMRGIENHNERLRVSNTNPDIDYDKSVFNINLYEDKRSYHMRIQDRIRELNLPKAVRTDAVVACGFICTSEKAYFEGLPYADHEKFFRASFEFLKTRYGERNVIASTVHYDETTPHLHCYIMPITPDGRLSAKSIFTKQELRSLQDDYHRHIAAVGFDLERGQKDGKRKHLNEQEFKLQAETNRLKEKYVKLQRAGYNISQIEQFAKTQQELNAANGKLKALESEKSKEVKALKTKILELEERNGCIEASIKQRDSNIMTLKDEISKKQTENDAFHDLAEVAGFIIDNASKLYQNENRYYSAMNDLEDAMAKSMGEENYHKWKLRGGNYGR